MKRTLSALAARDFATAESAATAFLQSHFDHFMIRRALAIIEEVRGRPDRAEPHIDRALTYKPEDIETWFQFSRIKSQTRGIGPLCEFFHDYPRTFPDLFTVKHHFYNLQRLFDSIQQHAGFEDAVRWLQTGLGVPETRAALRDSLMGRQASPARYARPVVDDERLMAALEALEAINPQRTVELVLEVLEDPKSAEPLNRVIPDGPDAGHPLWHVINPYFHLWAAAELETESAQDRWQSTEAISRTKPWSEVEADYVAWNAGQEASLARELLNGIRQNLGMAPTILDLGCGIGYWLRFFAEHCDIPIRNLSGIELHESRAACARDGLALLLEENGRSENDREALRDQVLAGDLLNLDVPDLKRRFGTPGLVTLFVVTGCFDDEQLEQMLSAVSALGAPWLMTTSVFKRWEFWHGRDDEDDFLARAGYHPVRRVWDSEGLPMDDRLQVVRPRKYWVNRALTLYRLGDRASGESR